MENDRREFYTSSNGDRWFLVKADGAILVRHEPNPASGGEPSEIGIDIFAGRNTDAPERQALVNLLRQVRAAQAGEERAQELDAANDDDKPMIPSTDR